ncbi:MAG: asparagine synthase (glutamine-hydrolyzing) [Candidatus Buchananbacteria bacterium]|nr:asparagine synthase (glutamine-hydrolyzing) [Candidatus Buchananbacteria bacterium]
MCGIAGFHGSGNHEIIKNMTRSLAHRGPNDENFYNFENLYFGFRRLSIIDLSTGGQPMSNEDDTVWIIFNGEIYNFLELRSDLEKKGHRFKSKTDTEVIIHLYEEKGEDFLASLNGMFALALWDQKRRKLIVVRDRLGQKPLYYSVVNNTFIFASELKAMFQHNLIRKDLDFDNLNKYFIYEYIPTPQTLIKGVHKLEPGHFLVWQNNQLVNKQYWDVTFKKPSIDTSDKAMVLKTFDDLLSGAVKRRLIADVPLGVFLSGGIDSSTITYYASRNFDQQVKTFSIGFDDKSFDESIYAQEVADILKTDHHHLNCSPADLLGAMSDVAQISDEPFADASIFPTHLLSKFTKNSVTVALGGDGGDELLAGYPTFQALKLAKLIRHLPVSGITALQKMINLLPASYNNFSFDFKLKRLMSGYEYKTEIQNQIWLSSFNIKENKNLLSNDILSITDFSKSFFELDNLLSKVKGQPLENRLIYLYLKQYLADDILVKADRASMYNSLEVRAPFMDYHLVDFINSLPYKLKLNGFTTKYILKELMKDKLPANIINRSKKGFGVPVAKWLNSELKDFTDDLLSTSHIKNQGIFNPVYVNKILTEHRQKKVDHRKKIWTLLMFQVWYNNWLTQ